MELSILQQEVGDWSFRNFGSDPEDTYRPLLGVVEEVGELSHAHLKGLQGIRHTPEEIKSMKEDAVGDIAVYLADYCRREGLDFDECVTTTWNKVKQRDWKANPMTAGDE